MSGTRRRSLASRAERFVLGLAMGVIAFIIERRVLRAIRRKGETPGPSGRADGVAGVGVADETPASRGGGPGPRSGQA